MVRRVLVFGPRTDIDNQADQQAAGLLDVLACEANLLLGFPETFQIPKRCALRCRFR
jgi:hypothetical protein